MSESLEQPNQEQNPINGISNRQSSPNYNTLTQDRQLAERAKEEVFYAGIFVDREELYSKFPPHLEKTVENPHITTNFAPDETQLHLEELGEEVKITIIGYGNDGKNEGLLVKLESSNPVIQKAIDDIKVPHITLSCSKDSHPMYTSQLVFTPLESPIDLTPGTYSVHLKDGKDGVSGPVVDNLEELKRHLYSK